MTGPETLPGRDDGEGTPGRSALIPCRCGHRRRQHGTDRIGRPTCYGSAVCACPIYLPPEGSAA